jgi:proline-specific peptidase
MKTEEGTISVDGHQVWYRRVGSGGGIPVLTLHGGPGAGHDYLEPLQGLAADRPVIFYDQLGCGRSDQPDDRSLWRIDRFVAEVETVRRTLGLPQVHLFGHSWGGWLAVEYMLSHPQGVASLILASTSASLPQFVAETRRLKSELPFEIQQTLQRYEASEDYRHPDYEAAVLEFYKRHLCRLDPWPEPLLRSVENLNGNAVYETMNGPNEFIVIGNLKAWDRTDRLGEIRVPTLITVGRYDELTPACAETLSRGIPRARRVVFENSAHLAFMEEPDRYRKVVADFMAETESPSK